MRAIDARWFRFCLLLALIVACVHEPVLLNSERIRQKYGSYGVQVLRADSQQRVSNLYSGSGENRICRTLAIVEFVTPHPSALAREHAIIVAGGSIGETFRDAGWLISKNNLRNTEIPQSSVADDLSSLMQISREELLASSVYEFNVEKGAEQFSYAIITEIYHPDYLQLRDLPPPGPHK